MLRGFDHVGHKIDDSWFNKEENRPEGKPDPWICKAGEERNMGLTD